MKYFIPISDKLTEVSEKAYDFWSETERERYLLPDYSITNGDKIYTIEIMYIGAIDVDQEPLPFILLYLEDSLHLRKSGRGVRRKFDDDNFEYFASFDEIQKRRNALIDEINLKLQQNSL